MFVVDFPLSLYFVDLPADRRLFSSTAVDSATPAKDLMDQTTLSAWATWAVNERRRE
jgi:hypothetical protein